MANVTVNVAFTPELLASVRALQSESRAVVADPPALRSLNYVRLTDGRVARPVEVDFARGFKGCVRLAESGEWLVLGPAPADAVGWTAECEPWVPRVGECVDGGSLVRGHVTSDPPVTPGVDVCVRGTYGFSSRVAVSYLTPVLDATGRPVVERGIHYPDASPLTIAGYTPPPSSPGPRVPFVAMGSRPGPATPLPSLKASPAEGGSVSDTFDRDVSARAAPAWTPRPGDRCRVDVDGPQRPPAPGTVREPRGPMVPGGVCVMLDGERAPRCYVGVTPLRPTRAGQRVRCAGGLVRVTEHETPTGWIVGPVAGLGLRTDEPTGALVVLADATPEYVPRVGDRVRAKGRTGVVVDLVYGPDQSTPTGCVITWDALAPGTRGERVEPEWHRSAWPWLELLAPSEASPAEGGAGGRAACWCGSGMKYGSCHSAADAAVGIHQKGYAPRPDAAPAYTPRVGDLVEWYRETWTVAEYDWAAAGVAIVPKGCVTLRRGHVFKLDAPETMTPLRPTAVGQRVRYSCGTQVGAVASIVGGRARVAVDSGTNLDIETDLLTRIADAAPAAAARAGIPPESEWQPCGSRKHATREAGTTCVHWWPCGCAVEPEGQDHLGLVNGEPRGVLVWGHGAIGEGFEREDAVSAWRSELAEVQALDDAAAPVNGSLAALALSAKQRERLASARVADLAKTRARLATRKAADMDSAKGEGDHAIEKRGTENERPIATRIHL